MVRTRSNVRIAWLAGLLSAALCFAEEAGTQAGREPDSRAWSPPVIEDGAYDDIAAYNIFKPDRADLIAEVEREPEVPEDPAPPEPVIELPPPDPDASLTLVGISVRGGQATAFIEDRATGEIVELQSPGPFSQGEVTAITATKITYAVEGESREVRVGFALSGDRPTTATPQTPASVPASSPDDPDSPDSPTDAGTPPPPADGLSDLERRMRERRRNE